MIQATDEIVKLLAVTSRHHPIFKEWFEEWYMSELTKLPHALNNTGVQQGRAQVLAELTKLIDKAPEIAEQRKL